MDLGLRGKVAVVTAASGGLGRAIAEEFAAEDAITVIAARNEAQLKTAAEEIAAKAQGSVFAQRADCTVEADIAAPVRDTVQKHGRLDVMICNSIGPKTAPFDEMSDEGWREALDVKVVAQIRIAREAFKAMQAQRSGCILFMAGTHGRQPKTYSVTAGVTNAALINASKVLAEAAAPFNIRVNAINPGPIETDRMVYLHQGEGDRARHPGGRGQAHPGRRHPAEALRRAARARVGGRLPRLAARELHDRHHARHRRRPGPGDLISRQAGAVSCAVRMKYRFFSMPAVAPQMYRSP